MTILLLDPLSKRSHRILELNWVVSHGARSPGLLIDAEIIADGIAFSNQTQTRAFKKI